MTAADPGDPVKGRYVTVALSRDAFTAAMASRIPLGWTRLSTRRYSQRSMSI
jgi:hypothetical protein